MANLLPGVRDLRAPLAAGYLWLLAIWLFAEPNVPPAAVATGVLRAIYRVGDNLGPVAVAVALSFAAYLIGVLSVTLNEGVLRLWPGGGAGSPFPWKRRRYTDEMSSRGMRVESLRFLGKASRSFTISPYSFFRIDSVVSERVAEADRRMQKLTREGPRAPDNISWLEVIYSIDRWVWEFCRDVDYVRPSLNVGDVALPNPGDEIRHLLTHQVAAEYDLLPIRLMGDQPEVFAQVDKTRAESEFRLAIVPPLVALIGVASVMLSWFWMASLVPVVLLLFTGIRKRKDAGDELTQAIQVAKVEPPVLQRLRLLVEMREKEARAEEAKEREEKQEEVAAIAAQRKSEMAEGGKQ